MSSRTSTRAALWSERRRRAGVCWRVVEAQHRVSTLKLADTIAEQERLERLLDETKPPVPPDCRHLHYLLATPFRYGAPSPRGSRFRRAGLTPGVFYGSQTPLTAMAETAFHRLLFFSESPATPWPADAGEYTAFSVAFASRAALDLTRPPLASRRLEWTHRTDYSACQALADEARAAGIHLLRYESARDTEGGVNLAVLTCRVFVSKAPVERQTWRLRVGANGAQAVCTHPERRLAFDREAFADDERIASLEWER